jgi:signal transduction histidine kinase
MEAVAMTESDRSGPRLTEELAAGLAHEVRNQLNSLQIHLGVLEQEVSDLAAERAAPVVERVRRMARAVSELDDFLTDFLRLAHPAQLLREPLDLRPLITELASFLTPEFAARGVALVTELAEGVDRASADRPQLRRALLNLVLNALQATPPGGRVTIRADRRPDAVSLTVRDTGAGVPAELRARLFEPFVSGRPGGTGLGLAIAQRAVEQHGGTIELDSGPAGSAFTIVLPDLSSEGARA